MRGAAPVVLPEALHETLAAAAGIMAVAREPWWVIASAAIALHGGPVSDVADVDILASVADARRVARQLGLELRAPAPHPRFRSEVYLSWGGAPLPVEFMAGFAVRSGDAWREVVPATRQVVRVGGIALPVPEREELRTIVESFGRAKDLRRADLLPRD